ncbi:perivitellin-2 67 kDa subunit-like [Physella acuta]|uniref:perivitellin-2 67 kDa subunit-like n=1 Tax=Physella acuta TaxID=109671 RepID=UPI0027DDA2A6|nr:perivitellin-2 67 kDa subunit-like [Physella acuta]
MFKFLLIVFATGLSLCHGEVDPALFVKNTKICLRVEPYVKTRSCGGSTKMQEFCGDINQMTPDYLDDTTWTTLGCKMQWGIFSSVPNPPAWMKNISFCMSWSSKYDYNNCNRDPVNSGERCAFLNGYSYLYTDYTDRSFGTCELQWIIIIPNDAPAWMKKIQLCFNWRATGDASQCKGSANNQCVEANKWTAPFYDGTNTKPGGCLMSWGLKLPS